MVRSMVAAVAGLKSHQSKMDVIGNNIANVNTWGFKSYSYNFQDSMYANSINGSGGSAMAGAAGGRNASQVGYGSTLSSITNEFGTGAPSPSSNPLDCMIDGTGFFLVGNMVNGSFTNVADSGLFLSRVGIFRVDNNGYLVDDQRSYVYGYALVEGSGIPEQPSTKAEYQFNQAEVTVEQQADTNPPVYDVTIFGVTYSSKSQDLEDQINDWIAAAVKAGDATATPPVDPGVLNGYTVSPSYPQETATGGQINLLITKNSKGPDPNGPDAAPANPGDPVDPNRNAATAAFLANGSATDGVPQRAGTPARYENELSAIRIPTDPTTGRQYEIQSYKINEDGTIIGVDKLNRTIAIGQLALVTVENPNGLEKTSGYYYTPGANAGDVEADKPNGGPSGKIMGGYLEMANVDLANEFSNMITTQRGFQANSKIITVTDEMLAELVNMKR